MTFGIGQQRQCCSTEGSTGHIHLSEYGRQTRQVVQLCVGVRSLRGPSSRATTRELVRHPVHSEKNERPTALGTSRPNVLVRTRDGLLTSRCPLRLTGLRGQASVGLRITCVAGLPPSSQGFGDPGQKPSLCAFGCSEQPRTARGRGSTVRHSPFVSVTRLRAQRRRGSPT